MEHPISCMVLSRLTEREQQMFAHEEHGCGPQVDVYGCFSELWDAETSRLDCAPGRDFVQSARVADFEIYESPVYGGIFLGGALSCGHPFRIEVRPDAPALSLDWYARNFDSERFAVLWKNEGAEESTATLKNEAAGMKRRLADLAMDLPDDETPARAAAQHPADSAKLVTTIPDSPET